MCTMTTCYRIADYKRQSSYAKKAEPIDSAFHFCFLDFDYLLNLLSPTTPTTPRPRRARLAGSRTAMVPPNSTMIIALSPLKVGDEKLITLPFLSPLAVIPFCVNGFPEEVVLAPQSPATSAITPAYPRSSSSPFHMSRHCSPSQSYGFHLGGFPTSANSSNVSFSKEVSYRLVVARKVAKKGENIHSGLT